MKNCKVTHKEKEFAIKTLKELKKDVYRGHPAHNYVTEDQINLLIKDLKK